jgi:glycosyltransferase involved in cell wall biosynthesis
MSKGPLVSIIIPTYNRAELVCQTIDNVFLQTYSNFELIVVDDGSTDDTQSRLHEYGDRIRVFTQANAGPAVARNRGIELARGEIIAFQDSDDIWKPVKLERQVALLEHFGSSVPCCLCNVVMRIVNGKDFTSFDHSLLRPRHEAGLWLNVSDVLATRFILFNQAVAIRRKPLEKVGGFDVRLKYLEDYDLPLRLALEGPWAFIREPLVIYGEASPESFSQAALKDPVVLKQCELKIYEHLLEMTAKETGRASFRGHLMRRLRMARRQLRAIQLGRTDSSSAARALSELVVEFDRYYLKAFRRSPWFPQPKTVPVDAVDTYCGDSQQVALLSR